MKNASKEQQQIDLLRQTLKEVYECIRHDQIRGVVVNTARPRLGLGAYVKRVLDDTRPPKKKPLVY